MAEREGTEDRRQAGARPTRAAAARRHQATGQRADAPECEQRRRGRGALERVGRGGHRDLDGAEQQPDGGQHHHERPHRRRAQRAAARPGRGGLGAPAPRAGCTAKATVPATRMRPGRGEHGAGGPQRAERQRERRPRDPGELDGRRLDGVAARSDAASGSRPGSTVRRQAPSGGVARPRPAASASGAASGAPSGSMARATSSAAATPALTTRTAVWPRRSASVPSSGPPTPSAAA